MEGMCSNDVVKKTTKALTRTPHQGYEVDRIPM